MLRKVLAVLSVALVVANPATSAEFHAVITNFGNAPRAKAFMDVSIDTSNLAAGFIEVLFEVFKADGTLLAEFPVPVNPNGFASSASAPAPYRNFFTLTGGAPALVRASLPSVQGTTATLHQRGKGTRLLVSVPPNWTRTGEPVHVGRHFSFHVGDLRGGATATILVANVSGGDVVADVFVGTQGLHGLGKYSTPRMTNRQTWRVDLAPDDENSNIVVTASAEVIVQLVIDDGRANALTVLPTVF